MAGAFSGHLLNSYNEKQAWAEGNTLITSAAMSFNPQMHGTPSMKSFSMGDSSFSFNSHTPTFSPQLSEETTLKIAQLQAKLNRKLGPEFISQRPGPGGGPKLTYAEGWKIINLANEVFGFNGWSSTIVNLTTDFVDFNEETKRYNVGTTAIIRVTLRDGVFHEDIGYGMLENSKSKGAALDKCKKEAVTDGLKRALRNFGNLLGNCLYDKSYTQEVVKIKVPPAKFDKSELYRRPEFEEKKPDVSMLSNCISFSDSKSTSNMNATPSSPPQHPPVLQEQQQSRPQAPAAQPKMPVSIPKHLRPEVNNTNNSSRPLNGNAVMNSNGNKFSANNKAMNPPQQLTTRPTSIPDQSNSTSHAFAPNQPPRAEHRPPPAAPAPKAESDDTLLDEVDDSFHFYSDDDAFLANVDMGEGDLKADLGRPIGGEDGEEDFGRPIDHYEGLGANPSDLTNLGFREESAQSSRLQEPINNGMQQANNRTAPGHRPSASGMAAPQLRSGSANTSSVPSAVTRQSAVSTPQRSVNVVAEANSNRTTSACLSGSGPPTTNSSNTTQHRPITPSMGGFNFPPGMDARQLNQQARPSLQSLNRTSTMIGQKRPSDAMVSSINSGYKGAGIGLSSRSIGHTSGQRQPLGPLEISEGGDLKRMRR